MKLLALFLFLIFLIAVVIVATAAVVHRHVDGADIDSQYFDENGDHIYYDRSLIEKKDFLNRYPHRKNNIRKFSHLFRRVKF